MGTVRAWLAALAVSAVVLVGCSGAPNVAVTTPVPEIPTAGQTVLPAAGADQAPAQVLANADNGKTITVKVGDTVSVQLRDRQWSPPVVDSAVLQVLPQKAMPVAGLSRWDYKAAAAGTTTLTSNGMCPPAAPGGVQCMSIVVYKVTVTVTP